MNKIILPFLFMLFATIAACGETPEAQPTTEGQIIQIIDNRFEPSAISASAGETILVYNQDNQNHWIASQSAESAFDDTGDIDTGLISSQGPGAFVVPESANSGDVIYFYDRILTDQMVTPNGMITIL